MGDVSGLEAIPSLEEAQIWADRADLNGHAIEHLRWIALSRAQNTRLDGESRKKWAKLALRVNARADRDRPFAQARIAAQSAQLRTLIIDQLGPDRDDRDWDPDIVAADILADLTVQPARARELSGTWRDMPLDQMASLRGIKNVTAPLARLLPHLQPGTNCDLIREWIAVRNLLP